MRCHVLKTKMLLDALMPKLHAPPQTIPGDNLAWRGPQIIAGKTDFFMWRGLDPLPYRGGIFGINLLIWVPAIEDIIVIWKLQFLNCPFYNTSDIF